MASGTTSEVVRTAKNCHENFGLHTDWIRTLIDRFPDPAELMTGYEHLFDALNDLSGIGTMRAVHIAAWIYNAFGLPLDFPAERLDELFGPNLKLLSKMCRDADLDLNDLFFAVQPLAH